MTNDAVPVEQDDSTQRDEYRSPNEEKEQDMNPGDMANRAQTLVLGGTGKTGRRVAERLAARGLPVRIGSRFAEPPFDWEDEAT